MRYRGYHADRNSRGPQAPFRTGIHRGGRCIQFSRAADPRPLAIANIIQMLAQNPRIDAIITMAPVHIGSTNPAYVREVLSTAEIISEIPGKYGRPLIATTMRNSMQGIAYNLMRERNIPFYEFPEEATRAMYGLYRYAQIREKGRLAV